MLWMVMDKRTPWSISLLNDIIYYTILGVCIVMIAKELMQQ